MSYTKLFSSILTSTIWIEDDKTRIVWITILALADKNGEIQASIPGLARVAAVSLEACETAIGKFLAPDKFSRTPDDEGRRIEEIEGGWALLNFSKYREMASKDQSKSAAVLRQERYRKRKARNTSATKGDTRVTDGDAKVTPDDAMVTPNRDIAEPEEDAEADEEAYQEEMSARSYPLPAEDMAADWSDTMPAEAARDLALLQERINGLHPSWKARPHFTRIELEELRANGRIFSNLAERDWQLLRCFMDAVIPPEWNLRSWQPDHRSRLIQNVTDVLAHADTWLRECGNRRIPTGMEGGGK